MNKKIIVAVLTVFAVGGLVWIARPGQPATKKSAANITSNGILATEETVFNFGPVSMAAGKVSHKFKVKNSGTEAVAVEKIYTSCMCTTASLTVGSKISGPFGMPGHGFLPKVNQIINPGEEAVVEVVFDPAAHGPAGVGRIERTVTVENNSGKALEFNFSALVTP